MKRSYYLFPLMAMTALSLSLAACDDKKTDETAAAETTTTEEAPVAMEAMAPAAVVHAEGATAYATAADATTGAVFLTLHNAQTVADKLVGASTSVASGVELHESATDANGVATMTKVDAIEIQPGQQVSLKPTGYHIMLTGLTAPLVEGTPFDITLDFETAADVTLPVTVTAPSATGTEAMPMDHSTMGTETPAPSDTTATAPTADESPAPTDAVAPTDEPVVDTTTPPPATAETPADEQPAQ